MPNSPRSTFIPHPCSKSEELHNWQALHRLLGRVPLEPTEDDDGKVLRWSNSQKRFILVSPCAAVADCGGSGDECGSAYADCSGVTPRTKTLAAGGTITGTGCADAQTVLDDSPYVLVCNGAGSYEYIDPDFMCGSMAIQFQWTLVLMPTEAVVYVGMGLSGQAVWKKTGLTSPYDCESGINGAYTFFSNDSTQADFSNVTITISD